MLFLFLLGKLKQFLLQSLFESLGSIKKTDSLGPECLYEEYENIELGYM